MGWVEGLWKRTDLEQVRLRPICEAEELPRQRLPKIDAIA